MLYGVTMVVQDYEIAMITVSVRSKSTPNPKP